MKVKKNWLRMIDSNVNNQGTNLIQENLNFIRVIKNSPFNQNFL